MDNMQTASSVLGSAIVEWLADEALHQSEPATLYGELCLRLRAVGIPVMRGQVAFRVLHPLYDASTLTWTGKQDVLVETFRPDQSGQEQFLRSPVGHALTHRLPVFRRRLTGATALLDFEVLEDFRALGGTDYLVFLIRFDAAGQNGVICSWLGDRAAGFTDDEIAQLQRVTRELGIALKSRIERSVARKYRPCLSWPAGRPGGAERLDPARRRGKDHRRAVVQRSSPLDRTCRSALDRRFSGFARTLFRNDGGARCSIMAARSSR